MNMRLPASLFAALRGYARSLGVFPFASPGARRLSTATLAVVTAALLGMTARHDSRSAPSPTGKTVADSAALPSLDGYRPTLVLFQNSGSVLERQFLQELRRDGPARDRDDLRIVLLGSLDSPVARRLQIRETPTLLLLAPGGREIGRRVGPQAITSALAATTGRAGTLGSQGLGASCRVWRGPRLRWVEEGDRRARRVYRRFGGGRWPVPDIFKAMSLRPELMEKALDLSEMGHFSDGYLDRRTKERIATLVSSLNGSHYCVGSHAGGLQGLGASTAEVDALAAGDLTAPSLSRREKALLEFVRRLTLKPGEVTDDDVARLRVAGWRDEQIFEAAFDASLFAFFNRMASTYGLDYPPDGWKPSTPAHQAALP
jgi:uncharacterized peroxidase-related enzyme